MSPGMYRLDDAAAATSFRFRTVFQKLFSDAGIQLLVEHRLAQTKKPRHGLLRASDVARRDDRIRVVGPNLKRAGTQVEVGEDVELHSCLPSLIRQVAHPCCRVREPMQAVFVS